MAAEILPNAKHAVPWQERISAWGASIVLHACLIAAFALIVFPTKSSRPEIETLIVVDRTETPVELERSPTTADLLPTSDHAAGSTQLLFSATSGREVVDAAPRTDQARPLDLSVLGAGTGSLTEKVSPVPRAASAGGDHAGNSGGQGGGFFGIDLRQPSVVFVVDSSRSMNHPHPGEAKTRFGRVKLELLRTVAGLTSDQKFFIIFFNTAAIPMPADRLMEATPATQRASIEWMNTLRAEGGTDPEQALMLALQLNPAVIHFLTDGDFAYKVVPNVTRANVRGVVIHTIGFGDDKGAKLLSELAARNSGNYQFIPEASVSTRPENKAGDQAASIISRLGSK